MMPVTGGHEQGFTVIERYFISFCEFQRGKFNVIGCSILLVVVTEIRETQHFERLSVQFVLFLIWKKQYFFSSGELCVNDMRHIHIKMHMRDTSFSTHKQHGRSFHKSFHQI